MFQALDSDPSLAKTLDSQTPVTSSLELKVGTQVMLTKNMDVTRGLVNGARGVVTGFKNGGEGKRNMGEVALINSESRFTFDMLRYHLIIGSCSLADDTNFRSPCSKVPVWSDNRDKVREMDSEGPWRYYPNSSTAASQTGLGFFHPQVTG